MKIEIIKKLAGVLPAGSTMYAHFKAFFGLSAVSFYADPQKPGCFILHRFNWGSNGYRGGSSKRCGTWEQCENILQKWLAGELA